jgi:hypothetical protein
MIDGEDGEDEADPVNSRRLALLSMTCAALIARLESRVSRRELSITRCQPWWEERVHGTPKRAESRFSWTVLGQGRANRGGDTP